MSRSALGSRIEIRLRKSSQIHTDAHAQSSLSLSLSPTFARHPPDIGISEYNEGNSRVIIHYDRIIRQLYVCARNILHGFVALAL